MAEQTYYLVHTVSSGANYRETIDYFRLFTECEFIEGEIAQQLIIKVTHPNVKLLAKVGANGKNLGTLNPGNTARLY